MRLLNLKTGLMLTAILSIGGMAGCGQSEGAKKTEQASAEAAPQKDVSKETKTEKKEEPKKEEANNEISLEKYEKAKGGMSYEEVVALIGSEGKEDSEKKIANTKLYGWTTTKNGVGVTTMGFVNNKLDVKFQMGLRPESKVTISKAQYDQLKLGMTYDEVKKLLGGEGTLIYEAQGAGGEFKAKQYTYKGESRKEMLTFVDGKLDMK